MGRTRRSRFFLAFLVGLLAGTGGETLLFIERQCGRAAELLRDDFKLILFLREELDGGRQKVREEQLRAMPDVENARYVSPQEAMAALRREDPDLVESVVSVSESPLSPAFEVKLRPAAIGRVGQWLEQ